MVKAPNAMADDVVYTAANNAIFLYISMAASAAQVNNDWDE